MVENFSNSETTFFCNVIISVDNLNVSHVVLSNETLMLNSIEYLF